MPSFLLPRHSSPHHAGASFLGPCLRFSNTRKSTRTPPLFRYAASKSSIERCLGPQAQQPILAHVSSLCSYPPSLLSVTLLLFFPPHPRPSSLPFHGPLDSQISCTYVELYNEKIFDLLRYEESRQLKSGLDIREDKSRGVCIPEAAEVIVTSQEEVLSLLWKGAQNRAVAATDMNEHSSRSHTVLQVAIEQRPLVPAASSSTDAPVATRSKLNLVDLVRISCMEEDRHRRVQ